MDINYSTLKETKNLNFISRVIINEALKNGDSVIAIAKNLGFSRQTIYNEIKKGTIEILNSDLTKKTVYDFYRAQYYADEQKTAKGRNCIISTNYSLNLKIKSFLSKKYSPEVIESFIKKDDDEKEKITAKTIYNNLYKGNFDCKASECLNYGFRKTKRNKKYEKNYIKPNGGKSIELRENIDDRLEFGHWEIDCVVGKRNGKSTCLMTLVERKTRYGIVMKIQNKTKKSIVNAIKKVKKYFGKYFYLIFKSITADNGSEFKDAIGMSLISRKNKIKIYFAHAYCSFERGTNENFNRFIRRYFPKGTNFCNVSKEKLAERILFINKYPRKQFEFKSSLELFEQELNKLIDIKDAFDKIKSSLEVNGVM